MPVTDKDHTYSDTISLNGVETGETDNGWWDDVGGRRVDTWVNTTGPGSDTNATYDYNVQTHNNRKEWTDDEVTYFRHDTHDYGHGEGNGSFTNPLDGVAYLTRNYTSDYDITGHEVSADGVLTAYTYNRRSWGYSTTHEDHADGYSAHATVNYDLTHNVALNAPGFDITDSGYTNVVITWSPSVPAGGSTGGYTPNNGSFHSDNPYDSTPPAQPPSGGGSIGQPGFLESMIPVWGSLRAGIDDFQNGRYGWAAFNMVMAAGDVVVVKAVATAAVKATAKVIGKALTKGNAVRTLFNSGVRTTEPASMGLIQAVEGKGRTITYALPGSDEFRYLEKMGANANVGGPKMTDILLRQNPTKVEVLEEFLHGTQHRLGMIDKLGVHGAERHVKEFMLRHQRLLGISPEDANILRQMLDK